MVKSTVLFFFQAEDGIRDIGVTGVQTCALPISKSATGPTRDHGRCHEAKIFLNRSSRVRSPSLSGVSASRRLMTLSVVTPSRSEERRVGKECRSRWSLYH